LSDKGSSDMRRVMQDATQVRHRQLQTDDGHRQYDQKRQAYMYGAAHHLPFLILLNGGRTPEQMQRDFWRHGANEFVQSSNGALSIAS
jgi:hypothetical protein